MKLIHKEDLSKCKFFLLTRNVYSFTQPIELNLNVMFYKQFSCI